MSGGFPGRRLSSSGYRKTRKTPGATFIGSSAGIAYENSPVASHVGRLSEPPGAQAPKAAFGRAGLETRPTELILFL